MSSNLDNDTSALFKAAFNDSADNYERHIGGCTRAVAKHVRSLLLPLPSTPVVLDNAIGQPPLLTRWRDYRRKPTGTP